MSNDSRYSEMQRKNLALNATDSHTAEWLERMQDAVDEACSPTERAELDRHLQTCDACRQEFAALQAMDTLLTDSIAAESLDAAFDTRLFAKMRVLDEASRNDAKTRAEQEYAQGLELLSVSRRQTWRLVAGCLFVLIGATLALAVFGDSLSSLSGALNSWVATTLPLGGKVSAQLASSLMIAGVCVALGLWYARHSDPV